MTPSFNRTALVLSACGFGVFLFLYSQICPGVITLQAHATAAQIIIDPANPTATEITVNEGSTLQLEPRVIDSAGNTIENAPLFFNSLSGAVATVDASGIIQAKKAGFSTLTVTSGSTVATATITVVTITSGVAGFEITGVAQDLARRLYLANTKEHTILRAEDLLKAPELYAGVNRTAGLRNDERSKSLFNSPAFVAFDQAEGSLYVSDSANNVIRRVRPGMSGQVETLAGTGQMGSTNGPANQATFSNPQGVALDGRGNVWVVDSGNHFIRRINLLTRKVETIAGKVGSTGSADGTGEAARFNAPTGIAIETESLSQQLERERRGDPPPPVSVIIADTGNSLLRRAKETGQVETINLTLNMTTASSGDYGSSTPSLPRSLTLPLPHSPALRLSRSPALPLSPSSPLSRSPTPAPAATPLTLNSPTGVAVDPLGNIYVSETNSGQVRVILQNGTVVAAAQANTFSSPKGIAITQNGRIVVTESNRSGREITYGEPTISTISPQQIGSRGGASVTVKGTNFAPDTSVVVAAVAIRNVQIQNAQTIVFTTPPLIGGLTTVTVRNRGGLAQSSLFVKAVPLSELFPGQITTVAGGTTFAGDGSRATLGGLQLPIGAVVDASGNLFIADTNNHRIRKVEATTGIITTVAGNGQPEYSGEGGPAAAAGLNAPKGVALDAAGNLFIADTTNYRVRRVASGTGVITTVAGGGNGRGDNGPATAAELGEMGGIAFDTSGNLYITEIHHHRVRRIDSGTKIITTVAGNGLMTYSGDGGPATAAALNEPLGIAIDSAGNLYIADSKNFRIRKVDAKSQVITTVAGNGAERFSGDNVAATTAALGPSGIAVDADGNLFISDAGNERIRKVAAATQTITTVAGGGSPADFLGDNGAATAASLRFNHGVVVDAAGNLLIADSGNNRIRKVDVRTQIITTIAGKGESRFSGDNGPSTAAGLFIPRAIGVDAGGDLFIADTGNNRVRRVAAGSGIITTFAGNGLETSSGDGGLAAGAAVFAPVGIAIDSRGNVFIATNDVVRKVAAGTQVISTVAGGGSVLGDNGPATSAALGYPRGITVDTAGNLAIADTLNNRIRKVDTRTQIITTVAGGGNPPDGLGDNGPATGATLNEPDAIAFDRNNNLYVAELMNHRIRRVDATNGLIRTVAGNGEIGSSGDNGPATIARLAFPRGVALDAAGNVYVLESNRIRKVDVGTGIITAVAGTGDAGTSGDNGPAGAATLGFPYGIAVDAAGNLFIADTYNDRIRGVRGPAPARRRP